MRPNYEAIGTLKNLFKLDAAFFETCDVGRLVDKFEFADDFAGFQMLILTNY